MWIGTQDGLNRYDGYEFVALRHDPFDNTALTSSYITQTHERDDRTGRHVEGRDLPLTGAGPRQPAHRPARLAATRVMGG